MQPSVALRLAALAALGSGGSQPTGLLAALGAAARRATAPGVAGGASSGASSGSGCACSSSGSSSACCASQVRGYGAEASSSGGGSVQEISSLGQYNTVMQRLKDTGAVGIIDFTAKWCGPCKVIAPVFEELAQKYPQVSFLKVDIDNEGLQPVVVEHGITGVPTFTMYKGARKVENFTGARVDLLRSVLQKHTA